MIGRLQKWFVLHCNGNWEHENGVSVSTMSDPGWSVTIDLLETALQGHECAYENRSESNPFDWYSISIKENKAAIHCGAYSLEKAVNFFMDEIFFKKKDTQFLYEIYLPIKSIEFECFILGYAKLISLDSLEIVNVPKPTKREIRVRDLKEVPDQAHLDTINTNIFIGKSVAYELLEVFDHTILTAVL